ncbi:presqualene diphosphate synthase HpnD [soil metagenome]
MSTDAHDAVEPFVAKWLAREPEMQFALNFCAPARRPTYAAWGALLYALREARFELREPTVADAKRAWWADELRAIGAGQPRHPLSRQLVGRPAPWPLLARELAIPADDAMRPADAGRSLALLEPLAHAVLMVESSLFDATHDAAAIAVAESGARTLDPAAVRSLSVHWRLFQLPRGLADDDLAGVPMDLLARHGLTRADLAGALPTALVRDWAAALRAAQAVGLADATPFRRAQARFDALRLSRLSRRGDDFAPGAAPRVFWNAWRAARG